MNCIIVRCTCVPVRIGQNWAYCNTFDALLKRPTAQTRLGDCNERRKDSTRFREYLILSLTNQHLHDVRGYSGGEGRPPSCAKGCLLRECVRDACARMTHTHAARASCRSQPIAHASGPTSAAAVRRRVCLPRTCRWRRS